MLYQKEIQIDKTKERVKQIERSLSPQKNKFYEYNKKFNHKTIFDDKKILEHQFKSTPAHYGNDQFEFENKKKEIDVKVLPTSNLSYGQYYMQGNNFYY